MNNETRSIRGSETSLCLTGDETEAPPLRNRGERKIPQPSTHVLKICSEINSGELTNLEFQLTKFIPQDMRYFARCFRHNQTIQSIVLPVHLFRLNDVLDDMVHFLKHNLQLQRVVFLSPPGCLVNFDVLRSLTNAISMNMSIQTFELSLFLKVLGNLRGLDEQKLNLHESNLKTIKVVDCDTRIAAAIFKALGNHIQCVELIAAPARIRGTFLGGAYGTPLQTETMEALSRLLSTSTSITKLVIKGYMGELIERVASALLTTRTVREIVLLSPRFLTQTEARLLKCIIEKTPSLESLTLDGRALGSDDFLLVSKAVASSRSVSQFSVAIDNFEMSPEILSTLLPKAGRLSKMSFGNMNFSRVPSNVFATMGHANLRSLSFDRTPFNDEQLQAILRGTANGELKYLRFLKLYTRHAMTRTAFDCVANCLHDNRSLLHLSLDCHDGLFVAYTAHFDEKRRCRVDARLRDVSRGHLDVLTEWLSATPHITLTKLDVQYAKQQTLEYLSEQVLGKFDKLIQFSITWPADVAPETRQIFVSAMQKNQRLLYISIRNRDAKMTQFVQFVQGRNRVKALLKDGSVGAIALWPLVLRDFERQENRSAVFVAARDGLGNFWLPDA